MSTPMGMRLTHLDSRSFRRDSAPYVCECVRVSVRVCGWCRSECVCQRQRRTGSEAPAPCRIIIFRKAQVVKFCVYLNTFPEPHRRLTDGLQKGTLFPFSSIVKTKIKGVRGQERAQTTPRPRRGTGLSDPAVTPPPNTGGASPVMWPLFLRHCQCS